MNDVPQIVEINEIIEETPTIKTFVFDWDMDKFGVPSPGEFVMVWNFHNEKPMSISLIDKENSRMAISVKNVGEFSSQLHDLKFGDKIGIRGSYGNGFSNDLTDKKVLAIGGGVGMAPINAIVSDLLKKGNAIDVVPAAVTKEELLFMESLEKSGAKIHPCTDDGSFGFEGFATDCTVSLLEDNSYDFAFVCGPEIMMKGIYEILEDAGISAEYSLERYMKCALGICGQCCVDNTGWRICVEGPVFKNEKIEEISEFGKYRRNAAGIKQ